MYTRVNGYITKVEVGTEVVSGETTRTSYNDTDKDAADKLAKLSTGIDVTLYFDYIVKFTKVN